MQGRVGHAEPGSKIGKAELQTRVSEQQSQQLRLLPRPKNRKEWRASSIHKVDSTSHFMNSRPLATVLVPNDKRVIRTTLV
jgi:hypothetical protein